MHSEIERVKKEFYLDDKFLEKFLSLPEETISPRHMFQWFVTIFYPELKNYNVERIRRLFVEEFPTAIQLIDRVNIEFESVQSKK